MDCLLKIVILVSIVYCDALFSGSLCYVGQKQSPINLDIETTKFLFMPTIQTYLYNLAYEVPLINTGHTVMVSFEPQTLVPVISKGILASSEYLLSQIHFHWNSEHTVNRQRFPLEAHFVHYSREARNFSNALETNSKVVVLTVFYELSAMANKGFDEIIRHMDLISERPNEPVSIKFIPSRLLPSSLDNFFTYEGSLTTPMCNEGIVWIIFDKLNYINIAQYQILTKIFTKEDLVLRTNSRPLQSLNDRVVYYSALQENINFNEY